MKVVLGTKCCQKIFQKFFRSKNKVFGPVKIPKKTFFNFLYSISWGLSTVTKWKDVVLFGFCTGTEGEILNFYTTNIQNSPLVPVQNPKSTTFLHLVTVLSPQEIEYKKLKKVFFGYFYRSKDLIFGPRKFLKNFVAAFGTQEKNLVPSTKYESFGNLIFFFNKKI
jgi:hypothetical protein